MLRKVFKIGQSVAITLSKDVLKDLGLKVGDKAMLESDVGRHCIVIKPVGKKEQLALGLKIRKKF